MRCSQPAVVVFDPPLAGPSSLGGPVRLQLWRRADDSSFARVAKRAAKEAALARVAELEAELRRRAPRGATAGG